MPKNFDFYFDFGSLAAYLAHTQLPHICADTGATVHMLPMLLGGVFKATGNASPVTIAAKARWMGADLPLWAQHYGVPFAFNPHFPINTLTLMRGACGVQMHAPQDFERYLQAVFHAMWVVPHNLGDAQVLTTVLEAAGFSAPTFMQWVADAEVKARLIANTEEAVARGTFGAPTIFVGEKLFFGQDRLDFVRKALA